MEKFVIQGGNALVGEITINGAKNSALPLLAASLLVSSPVQLSNIPKLYDIHTMGLLLEQIGAKIVADDQGNFLVDSSGVHHFFAPYELVKTMRASILVLGPLLARYGEAEVSLPGGCAIGARPVDVHIDGMQAMGAHIVVEDGFIRAKVQGRLKAADLNLGKITVTGTENLIMAASLAQGKTIIHNAACEPEVEDLAYFLNLSGAKIEGAGTETIVVEGVESLKGQNYRVMPDRIEAGTFLVAGAMTRGNITVKNVRPQNLEIILQKLSETGAEIKQGEDWISLKMSERPKAVDIITAPYPGFATDMQAQFMALNTIAEGEASVTETVFENRFMHVPELKRMSADLRIKGNTVHCKGKEALVGAPVMATDLRASASLILAGLVATGETTVERIYHVDRGYERIGRRLASLGAKIKRIND